MSDPSGFVWEAILAARKRTGRRLQLRSRAGIGWPGAPEFLVQEEFPEEARRVPVDLTGWLTMSGALVALRKL